MIWKCITLYQPWATLIAIGEKKIETRGWDTNYRGELYIHAGKVVDVAAFQRFQLELNLAGYRTASDLPTGKIIARCLLNDCRQIRMTRNGPVLWAPYEEIVVRETEISYGDYRDGRYGWILSHVIPLKPPIFARGMQGLWEYTQN